MAPRSSLRTSLTGERVTGSSPPTRNAEPRPSEEEAVEQTPNSEITLGMSATCSYSSFSGS